MKEKELEKIYYDPKHPASFSGPYILYKTLQKEGKKVSLSEIKKFLRTQDTYTLHRSVRRPYRRNHVVVYGIDDQWDMDLIDMIPNAKTNQGVQYILAAIDIFSRYVFLQPLKSKKALEVIEAMKIIFKERKPQYLRTDKGSEFISSVTQNFMKDNDIVHFVSHNSTKANYAERVIRTIKNKIVKYFTRTQQHEYVSQLQNFAYSYNHTKHRTINMSPAEVNSENEAPLWKQMYLDKEKKKKRKSRYKFKIGDTVLLSYDKTQKQFYKDYDYSWSAEVHTITHRYRRQNIPVYKVRGFDGVSIEGTFYQSELQKVTYDPDRAFLVEKVLKKKGKKVLVRWLGWPKQYDSWISK